jgi:hypothetical protein
MSHLQTAHALGAKQAEAYFVKEGVGKFLRGLATRKPQTMKAVKEVTKKTEGVAKPRHAETMPAVPEGMASKPRHAASYPQV